MTMNMTSKRIGYEVMELVNYCGPVGIETEQDTNSTDMRYVIKLSLNDLAIRIVFNNRYPFSPPYNINVNNKDYIKIVRQSITKFSQIGIEQNFPKCFCCESFTCADRWGPSVGLVKLCGEIKDVVLKKQLIMHIWFCRRIASEKLTYDIPLENYL